MRKALVVFLLLLGAGCVVLVLTGVPLAPPAMQKSSVPKQIREDIKYVTESKKESPVKVFFSHREFFYDTPLDVRISTNRPDAKLYYTLDGSPPDISSTPYTGPISLDLPDKTTCTVIKVAAVAGALRSKVYTHSYFVGRDVRQRFTSYVFSLSGDPQDFFGHERGILVRGKIYDDFMRNNTKMPDKDWKRPANYNMHGMEWERPVFVEAFTPEGRRILHQSSGVRVKGESSRGSRQKSLRIVARKRYDPKRGKFKYNFFPEQVRENGFGGPVAPYDSLVLGTSGSVYAKAQLIDPLITRQSLKAGYAYTSPTRSAAVFLNGEYYGHAWLSAQMNEDFFKKLCSTPDTNYEVLLGGAHTLFLKNPILKTEFKMLHYYAGQDMTDDTVFRKFSEKMDVHNLMLYMAIQLYVGNTDWPRNNVKIWRYLGEPTSNTLFSQGADGRWRYLLFDLEASLNTDPRDWTGHYTTKSVQNGRKTIQFLNAMLQRRELVDEFANHMCDMAFKHFSEKEAMTVAKTLFDSSIDEFRHAGTDSIGGGNPAIEDQLQKMLARISLFTKERPRHVLQELRELFGYTKLFTIRLEGPGKINTRTDNEGRYFVESSVPVTPMLPKWKVFDHWLVNGEKRTGQALSISGKDAVNGVVDIKLVTRDERPALFLADAYDRGEICGFSLHNSTQSVQNAWGLYLSDSPANLKKWALPDIAVAPGSKIDLVGQSYQTTEAMLKVQLSFNPRQHEVIFLSDKDGNVLDHILMPERKNVE